MIPTWGAAFGANAIFNSAEFRADLTHSAVPDKAAPGTTGAFTRATPKTIENNDGYLVTLLAGEIGFPGARRVRNLINAASSENLNAAGWTLATATFAGTKLSESAGVATHYAYPAALSLTAGTYIWSAEVSAAGRDYFTLSLNGGGTLGTYFNLATGSVISNIGAATGAIELLSNGNYRVSTKAVLTAASYTPLLLLSDGSGAVPSYAGDTSKGVNIFNAQLEDVTAQTTQTAGEYVSVGVASSPYYHGSMVDGVKCFPTDINGSPIPSSTLLGYQAQGARTNLATYSEQLDNAAWSTVSGVTVTANQYVAPDGATTMDRINVTAGNSTHFIGVGGITYTAAPYTLTMYLRYTNNRWAVIDINDAVTNHCASFDLLNGATGAVSAGVTSKIEPTSLGGVYRCHLTVTPAATGSGLVIVGANNTDTATLETWNAAGTETLGAWGAQVELGSFASSYIATTTAAVTRNADVLTYSSAGNWNDATGWVYSEMGFNSGAVPTSWIGIGVAAGSGWAIYGATGGVVRSFDGSNIAEVTPSPALGGIVSKIGSTWGSSTKSIKVGSVAAGSSAFDGSMNSGASIYIGCDTSGTSNTFATHRYLSLGQRKLSASELQAITA